MYQDLSMHYDWPVKKAIVNLPVKMKGNSRHTSSCFIVLHEKFLQFDWLRVVVFQLNLKYLHVKIKNLVRIVKYKQIIA